MSESQHPTGVYVKGDDEKVASTTARAVALVFEGYQLKSEDTSSSSAPEAAPVTETAPVTDEPSNAPATPSPKALAAKVKNTQEPTP